MKRSRAANSRCLSSGLFDVLILTISNRVPIIDLRSRICDIPTKRFTKILWEWEGVYILDLR